MSHLKLVRKPPVAPHPRASLRWFAIQCEIELGESNWRGIPFRKLMRMTRETLDDLEDAHNCGEPNPHLVSYAAEAANYLHMVALLYAPKEKL